MDESRQLEQLLAEHAPERYRVRPLLEAALVMVAVLLATFSTIYFIYAHALEAQKGEIRQGLLRTANIIATQIDPALHRTFTSPEHESSPEYIAAEDALLKILRSDPTIAFIYTAIKQEGVIRFVLDPTPVPEAGEEDSRVALLEEYPDPSEEIVTALLEHVTIVSSEPYVDQWGSFVSAYVPLFDEAGEFVAVIGVDIDATEYFSRLAPIRRATVRALVTAFFLAFLTASAVWFLRNFIAVLNERRFALYRDFRTRALQRLPARVDDDVPVEGRGRRVPEPIA
jgi:hypothetical protein